MEKEIKEAYIINKSDELIISSEEIDSKQTKWSYLRQIVLCFIISCSMFVMGFLVASTTMLPTILNENSQENYTSEDLKFLASIPLLVQLPSGTSSIYLTEKYGPTFILRWCIFLALMCYVLMASYTTLLTLWISRLGLYAIYGVLFNAFVALIAEISEPNIRGLCGAFPGILVSIEILLAYVTFSLLNRTAAIICNAVPIFIFFLGSFYLPESPYWLIKNGKKTEAVNAIERIIGPNRKAKRENLFNETNLLYENNCVSQNYKLKPSIFSQVKLLKKSKNLKSVMLVIFVYISREFGGISTIFHYILIVLQAANINIDVFLCTIIGGCVRLLSSIISALVLDKVGRRFVVITTTFVSAICLLISGLILHFELKTLNLVALIALMAFISAGSMGLGPMANSLCGEIIPMEIKFLGNSISNSVSGLCRFTIICAVPILIRVLGVNILFMIFGVVNFVASLTFYFVLPETNKKTMAQLQNLFK